MYRYPKQSFVNVSKIGRICEGLYRIYISYAPLIKTTHMRQFLTTFTTAILLLAGCSDKQETAQTVLTKVKDNYYKHSSIVYNINYKQKFFDGDDTLQ